jgi:energy-coupling factor transporter ATP-binding protein EcfA2
MAETIPISVSALHEILKWSADRPSWQRDALRRIILQEEIELSDIQALDTLCRRQHSVHGEGEEVAEPEPLLASHLPAPPGDESSVVLVSLANLQRVNRLPSDQTLTFGFKGMTVVYGDNGSGKSGYARVLKKACRSRGAPPVIRPDAYKPTPTVAATAELKCQVGGVEKLVVWTDGQATDAVLSNVFTFDGSCAAHYLTEDSPASFTPHGLDILPKLSQICDRVRDRLQNDITAHQAAVDATSANWKTTAATPVGILIKSLSAAKKNAEVEAMAVFSEADKLRLKELADALKSNPKHKAKETLAAAGRLRTTATAFQETHKIIEDTAASGLQKLIDDAVATEAAAKSFSQGQFDESFLFGTGSEVWKKLWEAAELYSSQPYDGVDFPNTAENARCLLCQRTLEEESRERFNAFRDFCQDQSQQQATAAKVKLQAVAATINGLKSLVAELSKIEADVDGIAEANQAAIKQYARAADGRLATLKIAISTKKWTQLSPLPVASHSALTAHATVLEARAATEESADDPVARAKLQMERDALTDREWLLGAKDDVLKQLTRLRRIEALKKCLKDTATNRITAIGSDLTKRIVTETFCERFQEEIRDLGLRTITVEMQEIRGKKGETRFGLRLKGADGHPIHEVASEGEQRCIGLAAFLAELSQASNMSALVFDDPVSSLDHSRRERIANRLVKESQARQVIVFTHETTFLNDLVEASKRLQVNLNCCYLEWSGSQPGRHCDGLPWDHMQPEERLVHLDGLLAAIRANWSPQPSETNRSDIRAAYSKLRNTLERVVEHVMLGNVVSRFRRKLNMSSLPDVLDLTQQECDEMQRLYQRCHNLIDAHDSPSAQQAATPEPDDLDNDIAATKKLIEGIRTRRKANAKAAKSASAGNVSAVECSVAGGT